MISNFVRYEVESVTVSEAFLYVGESFPKQNFHFDCTCGGFFGYGKSLFQSKN